MSAALFGLAVAAGVLVAYHYGKWVEREQVRRWLKFLHDQDVSPRRLAAAISVGQHYDHDGD